MEVLIAGAVAFFLLRHRRQRGRDVSQSLIRGSEYVLGVGGLVHHLTETKKLDGFFTDSVEVYLGSRG